MSDEKNMFEENENEVVEQETVEEVVEETTEEIVADEAAEEDVQADEIAEVFEKAAEELVAEKAEMSKKSACALSVVITLVVVAAALLIYYFTGYNRYNANPNGYSDTLETYAAMSDKTIDEVKEELSLPSNMKADTLLDVAQYYIPVKKMAENYGMEVDSLKTALQLNEEHTALITEETRWGEVTKFMRQEQEAAKAEAEKEDATASEEASEKASEEAQEQVADDAEAQETAE